MIHQILTNNANLAPNLLDPNDVVILVGDGVYWQTPDDIPCPVYYLEEDAKIRSLALDLPTQKMQPISHAQWVEMIDQTSSVKSWF